MDREYRRWFLRGNAFEPVEIDYSLNVLGAGQIPNRANRDSSRADDGALMLPYRSWQPVIMPSATQAESHTSPMGESHAEHPALGTVLPDDRASGMDADLIRSLLGLLFMGIGIIMLVIQILLREAGNLSTQSPLWYVSVTLSSVGMISFMYDMMRIAKCQTGR